MMMDLRFLFNNGVRDNKKLRLYFKYPWYAETAARYEKQVKNLQRKDTLYMPMITRTGKTAKK
jgi:hypothetical protein